MVTGMLPITQLESLKFKANQIIESIQSLQRTIESGGQNVMPAWPDILSKYNIILSQSHSFSNSLIAPVALGARLNGAGVGTSASASSNSYEKIALHPIVPMTDTQLDNNVIPLLRNQQTTDVLRSENDTVRRLSEHMATRGSLGVLGASSDYTVPAPAHGVGIGGAAKRRPEYEDVLQECEQIRREHDMRIERAVRAVTMLRDKFDWKLRLEVEIEEPEELEWDPRVAMGPPDGEDDDGDGDEDVGMESEGDGGQSSDEDEVVGELVHKETPAEGGVSETMLPP
jgi:hypothetical protein